MISLSSLKNFAEETDIEYYVLTPSMLGQFIRNRTWGIQAYYRKLYGKEVPKTYEMEEGERLHEKFGYVNKKKFCKKFKLTPNIIVELRGKPDKIDENGRPWEAKTVSGFYVSPDKFKAAKVQLLCYLFLMDKDYGFLDFISRETGKQLENYRTVVFRNDTYLMTVIKDFIDVLKKQKQLV